MNIRKYWYIRKQQISRFLALRLSRNRAFTAMQLVIKTLEANRHLPEKMIAIELFGFIGTSTVMDYSAHASYLELWEIDPDYARYAQRLNPGATVMWGDSVSALNKGKVLRDDYNFVVIDAHGGSLGGDGTFESFGVFEKILKYLAKEAVVIVTVYNNLERLYTHNNKRVADIDPNWLDARRKFLKIDNVLTGRGIDHLPAFEEILSKNNFNVIHSQFISRNDYVGFGVFVVEKLS